MIGDAPRSLSTGVPGWETEAEENALIALAQQYVPDGGVIVELGGEYGRSASQFGYACKTAGKRDILIYTVDLFPENHHIAGKHGGLLNVWRSNLAETGLGGHDLLFLPIQGDTAQEGADWSAPIDLLFIDAGHTYEEVQRDIEAWIGFVKPGGVVAFHDYAKTADAHPLHHEVKRAVDEWYTGHGSFVEWKPLDAPDSLVAFYRVETLERLRANAIVLEEEPDNDAQPANVEPVADIPVEPKTPARKRTNRLSKRGK